MQEAKVVGYASSPQQELVWRTARNGDDWLCPVIALVELRGPLDVERFRAAARQVAERHEILRTGLRAATGPVSPIQAISEDPGPGPEFEDLSGRSESDRQRYLDDIVARARTGEPVTADSLGLRVLRIAETRHLLLVRASAGVFDRPSAMLLVDDLARAYSTAGLPADEEVLQYADLAEWLNERVRDGRFEGPRFLDGVEDDNTPLRLPFAHPAAPRSDGVEPSASGYRAVALDGLVPTGAEHVLQQLGCELRDLLLAAWQVTLHRYAGAENLLTGLVDNGRQATELATAMGPLARLIPLRLAISEETTFRQVVDQVRSAAALGEADAELFDPLWWSNRDKDAIHVIPAFDLVDLGAPRVAGDLLLTPLAVHGLHPSAGLSLSVQQLGVTDGRAELVFDADRFAESDVSALGAVLRNVLADAVRNADGAAGALQVWHPDVVAGGASTPETEIPTVLARFAEQVAIAPTAVAVEDDRERLTYQLLDEVSAELAALLAREGVKRGSLVPILLERGVHVVAAMLAAWRAGAAFTVIDEATPRGRISSILAETSAVAVITSAGLEEKLPDTPAAKILIGEPIRHRQRSPADVAPHEPDDMAYVVFTSGSTGTPKGVMVSHGALAHYVRGVGSRLPETQGRSFAVVGTFAADLGYTAVFSALSSGGRLSIVPACAATDVRVMEEWISSREIDCLKIVGSHLSALLAAADNPARVLPRRSLVLGGEACPVDLVERVRELAPDCAVVNHYGPTETTIGVCAFRIGDADLDPRSSSVPIGEPLPGNHVTVLDRSRRVVPAWMPGELHVSGPQVAQGYLNQPGLTAERFVTEPSGPAGAVRWYRTGDVVRQLPNGTLEYLGRVDQQVKINGYRVELLEIASVLRSLDGVRECVVAVTAEPDRALTAYVVRGRPELSADEIRDHARHVLPDYMLPKAIVFVDAVPRTKNGKVDRKALLAIDVTPDRGTVAGVPPRDSLELRILEIWRSLLNSDRIGVTDDFFQVGGHSLLSLQLLAEISRQLGHRLPISVLFDGGTVEGMARAVREQESWKSQILVPIRAGGTRSPLFCVHAGGGSVMGYLDLVRAISPDVPVYGLESVGLDGKESPLSRVEDMAERYAAEILAVSPTGPCGIVGWGLGAVFAYAVAERLRSLGRSVGTLVAIDGAAPDPRALADVVQGRSRDPYYMGMLDDDVVQRFALHYQLPVSEVDLAGKSDEQQRAVLAAAMRQHNVLATDAGAEHLEALFTVYRSNIAAARDYVRHFRSDETPACPMLLLRATHQFDVESDPLLGWPALFDDRVTVETFAGDHYEVMRSPTVDNLAVLIEKAHGAVA